MKENDKELLTLANMEKDLKQIYKNAGSFHITLIVIWLSILIFIFICFNKWTQDGSTLELWQKLLPLLPITFICVRTVCLISIFKKYKNPFKKVKIKIDEFDDIYTAGGYFNDLCFAFFRGKRGTIYPLNFINSGFYYCDMNTSAHFDSLNPIYYGWSKKWSMDLKELLKTLKHCDKTYVLVENDRVRYFYPDKMFKLDDEVEKLLDR